MIIVRRCRAADEDQKLSDRQYAHTFHYSKVICIAGAWIALPINHEMAVIAHEVGHLLAGKADHTEKEADRIANKFFGIRIRYIDTIYGDHLQHLSLEDTMNVWEWIGINVKFEGRLFERRLFE